MKQKSLFFMIVVLLGSIQSSFGFCGFYVAKADASLFNNKSEVILVRDGLNTVITMSSDFKGDVRDFAMVVPVPVVLKQSDVRIIERNVFDALDAYSAPRLVEYYESNPCGIVYEYDNLRIPMSVAEEFSTVLCCESMAKSYNVTIEAQFSVDEYDVLILSATESNGLKNWLTDNGYKIPEQAEEVLEPYIKSNMKFFVVKVNLEQMRKSGYNELRPIQVSFAHEKFMLPLRLGMANSQGSQDMIVYAFTKSGRIECTNYRTVKMPTDRNIPLFVQEEFGSFYTKVFDKMYKQEGRNAVFLEYAWNVTPSWGGMKCDPCVGPPPMQQEFVQAGVNWANSANTFFTRLHVRYSRDKFPADLQFQVTPNTENYQARYVLTHSATGAFDCQEGQDYVESVILRCQREVDEFEALTGSTSSKSNYYINQYKDYLKNDVPPTPPTGGKGSPQELGSTDAVLPERQKSIESESQKSDSTEDADYSAPHRQEPMQTPGQPKWWMSFGILGGIFMILFFSREKKNASH